MKICCVVYFVRTTCTQICKNKLSILLFKIQVLATFFLAKNEIFKPFLATLKVEFGNTAHMCVGYSYLLYIIEWAVIQLSSNKSLVFLHITL